MQFYYITRWHRCCILTQRVINKVHIGPQLEYIISKQFSVSKTLFHSAHHVLKLIKIQQVQQATSYPSDCCRTPAMERRSSASLSEWEPNVALAGLYAIPATSHQMSGLVDRQAYIQII